MADKIYCGKGVKKNDKWLKATVNPDKILEHIQEFKGNKFVKLDINIKDEPDKYGKDVSISIDTWRPEGASDTPTSSSNESKVEKGTITPDEEYASYNEDIDPESLNF